MLSRILYLFFNVASTVLSEVKYRTMLQHHHRLNDGEDSYLMSEVTLHKRTTKRTESRKHSEGNSFALKQRQVGVVMLGNALGTTKIKSNLHIGQYAGSLPSDHSQEQALGQPLSLPGITKHINKFLCEAARERCGGLTTHTSGFDCDWLKVIIVEEVIIVFLVLQPQPLLLQCLPVRHCVCSGTENKSPHLLLSHTRL